MAKQARKRPHIVRVMEYIAEKRTKQLMDAAKKRYERFEKLAKKAKTEDQKQKHLNRAYAGLILAGHLAGALKAELEDLRATYLKRSHTTDRKNPKAKKRRT